LLNNPAISWFYDFNGWLFFLLMPVVFAVFDKFEKVKEFFALFFAAIVFLSVKTIYLFIIFTYGLPGFIDPVYQWLRNAHLAEVTFIAQNLHRIFMQSQVFLLAGFFVALALLFLNKQFGLKRKFLWLIIFLSATALLASLSRSYWVGWFGGTVFIFGYSFLRIKIPANEIFKKVISLIIVFALSLVFLQFVSGNFVQIALGWRINQAQSDSAGQSRLQQLEPLKLKIAEHPVLGSGFGLLASYRSSDPRVLKTNPNGLYTTSAFEWGYLDIWLKMGLAGLLAYLVLIVKIGLTGLNKGPLGIGLTASLIALVFTSIFSPYLNHPLGIGFLLMISAIFFVDQNEHGKS